MRAINNTLLNLVTSTNEYTKYFSTLSLLTMIFFLNLFEVRLLTPHTASLFKLQPSIDHFPEKQFIINILYLKEYFNKFKAKNTTPSQMSSRQNSIKTKRSKKNSSLF